eukprot:TRINITY_DN14918_c0_g1_i1.p1 TRINITY_DN14918_c0_g1~~TRINITY_DN14918_c0_g1_i1.p1  ORF type:complete len:244 (-),score=61.94 TRINITY_DN14918_c0_g1_i1:56-787(-)
MEILESVQARRVTILAAGNGILTILTCYIIAVMKGHVPAWLPMISDCAVQSPESYIFRLGMISTAMLLECNSILMLAYLNTSGLRGKRSWDLASFVIVSLGCLGLAIVGAVNEKENGGIHGGAAVAFFVCYQVYMIIITRRLMANGTGTVSSTRIKAIIASYCGVALLAFFYFSTDQHKYHIPIAICEWTGVAGIILYNLSFVYEYGTTVKIQAVDMKQMESHHPMARPEYILVPMQDHMIYQ